MPVISCRTRAQAWAPVCAFIAFVLLIASPAAGVVARQQQQTTTSTPTGNLPQLVQGATVTGGVVHTPGAPDRRLDAKHASAFMQAWFFDSVIEKLPQSRPPAGLPVSRLALTTRWHQQDFPMTVYYACQAHAAWVGMPPQGFGWAFVDKERWIEAPQSDRVIAAFNGKLLPATSNEPVTVPASLAQCAAAPATQKATGSSGSSSSAWPWVALGVAAVAVVGGGAWLIAVRRRRDAAL